MGFRNRIAFVVPTKDRPRELRRMLRSLERQEDLPGEVILVDGGDYPVAEVAAEFPALKIRYHRVYPPSLSRQRNAGIAAVDPTMTLAGYLDDDLVLEPGAMAAMLSFWEEAGPEVGGASFNIVNETPSRTLWLQKLFLLAHERRGILLRSGFETSLWPGAETRFVGWLCGGATVWRREVVAQFRYDGWFEGNGYLEDVDFSFRVGRSYRLAIVGDAKVQHLMYPIREDRNYLFGKWQSINRMYFVRKHPEFSVIACYWALLGQIFYNLGLAAATRQPCLLARARGNLVGLASVLRGRLDRIGGFLKS